MDDIKFSSHPRKWTQSDELMFVAAIAADALAGYAEALNKRERWDDLDRAAVYYAVNRRLIRERIHVVA